MYSVCRPTFLDEAVLVLVRPVSMGGGPLSGQAGCKSQGRREDRPGKQLNVGCKVNAAVKLENGIAEYSVLGCRKSYYVEALLG